MSYGILPLFSSQLLVYNLGNMNQASSSSFTFPEGLAEILEGNKVTLYSNDFSSPEPELYNYYQQPDQRDINVPLQPPLMIDYQYGGMDNNHGLIQPPFSPGTILSDWGRQQSFCTTENPKKRMSDVCDQKGVKKKHAHQERMQGIESTRDRVPMRRSQKLADKITALQKLVSPYGKTDTASVLHEAHISINLLHDQIQKLLQNMQNKEAATGLHNRGLCLVPITSPLINNLCQEKQIFMPRKY